jgi:peptide/nickel transport system substrate-binding protein
VYSAKKLKENPRYPETEVMGTGAFKFVEYVKGSHWRAVRFDDYFRKDRPYLDGFKIFFVRSNTVVNGLRGGQYDAEFRGRTPQERDQLLAVMKDQVTVQEGPWTTNILLTFNTEHKPLDDIRVRQALTLAIDRWGGSESLGKISLIKGVGGVFRPGAPWELPVGELEKMPGFWRDIEKSRAEARRLLKEAGVSNLKLKFINRTIDQPFIPAGIYAVDQWRRIGVEAEHVPVETKLWYAAMEGGEFDVVVQNISDFADDPTAQFNTLLSKHTSGIAYSRHGDTKLDEMFNRQSQIVDRAERLKLVNEMERYALTTAYNIPLLWYQRIVVNHKKVKGWYVTPSHFTGQSLVDVWLDE